MQISGAATITGINVPVPVTVSGGTYSINDGAFNSEPGTLINDAQLSLQVSAPDEFGETLVVTVDIGGEITTFEISIATQFPDVVVDGRGGGAFGLPLILLAGLGAFARRRRQ